MDYSSFLMTSFKKVVQALDANQVDFAVCGGMAYSILVSPRATIDFDCLIMAEPNTLTEINRILEPLFDSIISQNEPMEFKKARVFRTLGVDGGNEYIMDFILGETRFHQEALSRKKTIDLEGISLPILTPEDLLLLKALANRPQDRVDISNIVEFFGDKLDQAYLERWKRELNVEW
jgi:predicted nucleotidyltransferase